MADKEEKKKKPVRKPRSLHDEAVKEYFSDIETAKSFFTEYLPAEIVNNLDFKTLRICKDTFLDKKLAKYFSDTLYQVNLNNISIFIYLLIDHKSREEPFMGFQFLKYMVRIWELHLKQNKKAEKLPVIIPMVIYHGPKKWEVDKRFTSFFNAPGYLEEYIPDFNYRLYDISHVPDEEIKGGVLLRILLMTLKYIFTPELNYRLREEIFPLFHELKDKKKGTEYLDVLLRYLTRSARGLPEKELDESVSQLFEEGGELMQTIAEKWKREGIKIGEERGIEKKAIETAKNLLEMGIDVEMIAKATGLKKEQVEKLASINH
ncbi:MAG: Rpn family recombination-promoting nuclease/putative transposase [Candidatus Aminicenantes bacterium]|nr:MAG: Rpn family recombination-promoting nuclease/putative transposase [Candidatus Aminicenantes bacterium]